VLASSDPELVRGWADRGGFDDLRVWERLRTIAPTLSAHRVVAAARIEQLRVDYGLRADDGLTTDATFVQRPRN
jgi:hypothetical protein